jgi:hypothetical protein
MAYERVNMSMFRRTKRSRRGVLISRVASTAIEKWARIAGICKGTNLRRGFLLFQNWSFVALKIKIIFFYHFVFLGKVFRRMLQADEFIIIFNATFFCYFGNFYYFFHFFQGFFSSVCFKNVFWVFFALL